MIKNFYFHSPNKFVQVIVSLFYLKIYTSRDISVKFHNNNTCESLNL